MSLLSAEDTPQHQAIIKFMEVNMMQNSYLSVQDMEQQVRRHEADLKAFLNRAELADQLLHSLAKERFNTIVDVQSMVQRYTEQLEAAEVR